MHVRKGDMIEVQTGNDAGRRARVMRVLPKKNQVVAEGVNEVYKHLRRDRRNPQGGRLQKESAIDASNVMVVCSKCDKATRVGYKTTDAGKKVRVCRKCNAEIGSSSR